MTGEKECEGERTRREREGEREETGQETGRLMDLEGGRSHH